MKFPGQRYQKLKHWALECKQDRQTDTETDATENITVAAFAGGKNSLNAVLVGA